MARRHSRYGTVLAMMTVAVGLYWGAQRWLFGPLYHVGDVRNGVALDAPLVAAVPVTLERWRVAPGIELHHFEDGAGENVLVVHGGPGFAPSTPWPALHALASRYRFVYYHQRGAGLSTRPFVTLPKDGLFATMQRLNVTLGLPAQVADLERLRRMLAEERITLVGHSFGALIASLYAAEFPEHVRALVLVAPADLIVMPSGRDDLFALIAARLPKAKLADFAAWRRELFDFRRLQERNETELATHYARFTEFYSLAVGGNGMPSATALHAGGFMPMAVFSSMGQRHDWRGALANVTAPVLVIHGGQDVQPAAGAEALAADFPHGRFALVPAAGHFVQEQAPDAVARLIGDFLGAVPN